MSYGKVSKREWPRKITIATVTVISLVLLAFIGIPATADDGPMVRKQVTRTPNQESDHAQLSMMQFYIPATRADGTQTTISYYADRDGDNQADELQFDRAYAKPLIVTYQDEAISDTMDYDILTGDEVYVDIKRDAYAAFSFDDGETWKEINLSESAIMSSFTLANGTPYPGDVTQNRTAPRYNCSSGCTCTYDRSSARTTTRCPNAPR